MKVVQVVVHRLDVVQNVADSALRVVLECVCRPLRDTSKAYSCRRLAGGGDQLVGAFQSRADADLGLQGGSIYTVSAPILLTNHIL